jgi:hypothetical protein
VTTCATAQVAADQGLTIPLPRVDKRSATRHLLQLGVLDIVGLPSPSSHSFAPRSIPQIGAPTHLRIRDIMEAAFSQQQYLISDVEAEFALYPKP